MGRLGHGSRGNSLESLVRPRGVKVSGKINSLACPTGVDASIENITGFGGMSNPCQLDFFGFSPSIARRQRDRSRSDLNDFRNIVEDTLRDLGRELDDLVETLRDALAAVEDDEARSAIDMATDELEVELEMVLARARREIGL